MSAPSNALWLESRMEYQSAWQRFLPLDGLPFSSVEMRLLLDGRVIVRERDGLATEFRIERKGAACVSR